MLLPPGDVIEVATAAGSFGTLAGALTAANNSDTALSGCLHTKAVPKIIRA